MKKIALLLTLLVLCSGLFASCNNSETPDSSGDSDISSNVETPDNQDSDKNDSEAETRLKIGENGNWWFEDIDLGIDAENGTAPEVDFDGKGYLIINGVKSDLNVLVKKDSQRIEYLCRTVGFKPGTFSNETGEVEDNSSYGYILYYYLYTGHTLSLNDKNYWFTVRKYENGNFEQKLKTTTTLKYTADEDMIVGIVVQKKDKSPITADELAGVLLVDNQYTMTETDGLNYRFYVDAQSIEGKSVSTRCNVFLPSSYAAEGEKTPLVVMTNGYSAHLTDKIWNENSEDNLNCIYSYLNKGYAVLVVNNTAEQTSQIPDLGCPQLVDSYLKAISHLKENMNFEEQIIIHSRSFGTFSAIKIMQEIPDQIRCAVMTGPRVSFEKAFKSVNKSFVANRFGFSDESGKTYEREKLVGHDPYTDIDGEEYSLPPTFWIMGEGDSTEEPEEFIVKLADHGNYVEHKMYYDVTHNGVCTLYTEELFADAIDFIERH